jgi:hypothetical protein
MAHKDAHFAYIEEVTGTESNTVASLTKDDTGKIVVSDCE